MSVTITVSANRINSSRIEIEGAVCSRTGVVTEYNRRVGLRTWADTA